MRIDTSGPVERAPRSQPTQRQRGLLFVVGAVLGGAIGYGLRTSGPGPHPALFSSQMAPWILVPAVIVGTLAALFPDAVFLRPSRRSRWNRENRD